MPIVRIDVDIMKERFSQTMITRSDEINAVVQQSIDAYFQADNFETMIKEQCEETVKQVLKSEIDNYFKYGEGHMSIKHALEASVFVEKQG